MRRPRASFEAADPADQLGCNFDDGMRPHPASGGADIMLAARALVRVAGRHRAASGYYEDTQNIAEAPARRRWPP